MASPAERLPTTYVTPDSAGTIAQRFSDALRSLDSGKFQDAARQFRTIFHLDPDGAYASAALFNAALSEQKLKHYSKALKDYQRLQTLFPDTPASVKSLVHTCRLSARLSHWKQLDTCAQTWLATAPTSTVANVEALASAALAAAEQHLWTRADHQSAKAINLLEAAGMDRATPIPMGAATAYFARGEVQAAAGEKISFDPLPTDFADVLEHRCQSLLDAQRSFATAMRGYDPYWAGLSGLRIAQLYQHLHADILRIPPPATATTKRQKELFAGAMQLRYRILLTKGIRMLNRTIAMADRSATRPSWLPEAKRTLHQLTEALHSANRRIAALPYAEKDLRRALDNISTPQQTTSP